MWLELLPDIPSLSDSQVHAKMVFIPPLWPTYQIRTPRIIPGRVGWCLRSSAWLIRRNLSNSLWSEVRLRFHRSTRAYPPLVRFRTDP